MADRMFEGTGEMRARCRDFPWASTPLGPTERWPQSLRRAGALMLEMPQPVCIAWGTDGITLYNDEYIAVLGARHPHALGTPFRDVWADMWEQYGPVVEAAMHGEAQYLVDQFAPAHAPDSPQNCFTCSLTPIREEHGETAGIFLIVTETTHAAVPLKARRAAERRHAFLLALSDALQSLTDALEIQRAAMRVAGEYLQADRALYSEMRDDGRTIRIADNYVRGDTPKITGDFDVGMFGAAMDVLRRGETLVIDDQSTTELKTPPQRDAIIALGVLASATVPLIKDGRWVANFGVLHGGPRTWTSDEIAILRETAERTWDAVERARAEAALRASEAELAVELVDAQRLQRLSARLIDDGDADALHDEFLDAACSLMRADMASLQQFVPERNALRLIAHRGFAPESAAYWTWVSPEHSSICGIALAQREPLVVADIDQWDVVRGTEDLRQFRRSGIRAVLSVPLVSRSGRLVGMASTHWRRTHTPSERELRLFDVLARQAADMLERRMAQSALRESEARYRHIVEGARDYAILTTDTDGVVTSWSPGAESVFGWTTAEMLGQSVAITFTEEDRANDVPATELAQAARTGVAPDVRWHRRRDDALVFIEGTTRALYDDAGALRGFLKVGQDVTRRRALDEALRASDARYRTLVDNVHDYAIFLLDPDGRASEWTNAAARVKGYRSDEVVGQHVAMFYTPESVAAGEPQEELAEAAAHGRTEREGWRVRKGGARFWVNQITTAVRDAEGRLIGFTRISRDLTERRVVEAAAERARLAAARDELRRALANAEEAERRRLALELHDQLGQELTAFQLGLDDALRRLSQGGADDDRESLRARLAALQALAVRMTAGARYLALEVRPPELDDMGLGGALETYVRQWSARYGVTADVVSVGAAHGALTADAGSTLYRITQEALTNIAKHARATRVSVIVDQREHELRLIVEDDGRGFEMAEVAERVRRERRLGLSGMRERAALVGGTLEIESSPGKGTTLYVRLPVDPQALPSA